MRVLHLLTLVLVVGATLATSKSHDKKLRELMREMQRSLNSMKRDLTQTEKDEVINEHNKLRAEEGASDMEYIEWDDFLASEAQKIVDTCTFSHGDIHPTGGDFTQIGQNLFMASDGASFTSAIKDWYAEKQWYTYDTMTCSPDEECGHYTQVVWATTNRVGCAKKTCASFSDPDANKQYKDITFVVCDYGPNGNWEGQKPYTKGSACSACPAKYGFCYNGECRDCEADGVPLSQCTCSLDCGSCGTLNAEDCECKCVQGYSGKNCEVKCADKYPTYCGKSPGWPKAFCTNPTYGALITANCPKMCGTCQSPAANACSNKKRSFNKVSALLRRILK